MKLVIAEKPSVAMSLAAVLGATERKDGYLEGSGYLVSWCVGHLLELAQPEAYKEQYAKWRYEDLPILPENWKYEVPKDKKTQLALLCRLMKDKRVDSVVCATDAGREGELIFRLVYEYAGCKKPMERLWISSMEDAAIREGFDHLHPGSDYDKLYDAAVCRAGADWLIGINATRLFSVLYGVTLNVGRVMSPTLALLVQREATVQYAFMNATPVTTKADSILISDITELIHSSLKLSDFQQDLNPNYPDTRFVFGYAHDKEIYSLEVEGQKPDGVIEINVYDRTMYLWYYDDLKSDKRGNNLSYSVDMPE